MAVNITIYETGEVVDAVIKTYQLKKSIIDRETTIKKIHAICKSISVGTGRNRTTLFEKSKYIPKGKKATRHRFTENEKKQILNSTDMKIYILKILKKNPNATNELAHVKALLKHEVELAEKAEQLNDLQRDMYAEIAPTQEDNDTVYFYSMEDVKNKKMEIMLEALYLKFFEPIDEELLHMDMETKALVAGTTDNSAETMASIYRLEKHDYCHEINGRNK